MMQQKQINEINQKNIQNDNNFFRQMYQNDLQLDSNSSKLSNINTIQENKGMSLDELMMKRNSEFNTQQPQQQPQQFQPQQFQPQQQPQQFQPQSQEMIPQNQNYFKNDEDELDSLYQNRSMSLAKQELENPMTPLDMEKYLSSRDQELSPSNFSENMNISINFCQKIIVHYGILLKHYKALYE